MPFRQWDQDMVSVWPCIVGDRAFSQPEENIFQFAGKLTFFTISADFMPRVDTVLFALTNKGAYPSRFK